MYRRLIRPIEHTLQKRSEVPCVHERFAVPYDKYRLDAKHHSGPSEAELRPPFMFVIVLTG
jgi:hypothetical protein